MQRFCFAQKLETRCYCAQVLGIQGKDPKTRKSLEFTYTTCSCTIFVLTNVPEND